MHADGLLPHPIVHHLACIGREILLVFLNCFQSLLKKLILSISDKSKIGNLLCIPIVYYKFVAYFRKQNIIRKRTSVVLIDYYFKHLGIGIDRPVVKLLG